MQGGALPIDELHASPYCSAKGKTLEMEFILDKKPSRQRAESSIPEEVVLKVRLKRRPLVQGESWTPLVADFFMDLYPDMIENGSTLSDISMLFEEDDDT